MIIVRTDDAIYTGGEAFYLEKMEYADEYTVVFANEEAVDITKPLPPGRGRQSHGLDYRPDEGAAAVITHRYRHERVLKEGL